MALSSGERLGPYEILAPIGAGGMGEVWKARDTRLGRIVAIKQLKGVHSGRFEQEARAIAALNHPHICQIYDVGPDFLVLEYIEGKSLAGPLPHTEAVRVALQIAAALEAAHAKGILHRDLKPGNILMTGTGAKLLDFGLAKLTSDADATQTIGVAGTPLYMSPEQAEGKPLDARSDVFSFGTVFYELLGGKRAFDSLASVVRDSPVKLPVSPELDSIVTRCLAKTAAQRFQTMTELRAALERALERPSTGAPSIAVLPFANMSRDADDEYFSDGLAEEIINALVKVPGLKVIARTSAFAFKGQNIDIRKIAGILGVTHVLEGSVRRAGNRIRVTAQLINAADGTHLWSERYDRQIEDLFAMQDEIAAAIASELKLKFGPGSTARPRRQPLLQAYEAYLRYRQHQWALTPEGLRRSRECLEQAIAFDPEFALPYVGLADHHFASNAAGKPADEAMPRARQLAQRALDLDPDLPEAHGMLGIVAGLYDLNWTEAERHFRLAMAGESVHWHLRQWYFYFFLLSVGRLEEARAEAERSLDDNPLGQICHQGLSSVLEALGLEEQARSAAERAVELDPGFWYGWTGAGMLHAIHGRRSEARRCAETALAIVSAESATIGLLAALSRQEDDPKRSEELLARLPAGSRGSALGLACFHLVSGEIHAAVESAITVVEERYPFVLSQFVRPFERLLRQSPRWPALMRKLNLPDQR